MSARPLRRAAPGRGAYRSGAPERRPRRVAERLAACAALLVGAAALLLAGCDGGAAPTTVSLQLNWLNEAEFVGYYVAQAKEFYKDQGLDVTILEGGPGTPARDKVMNGKTTFAVTSFAEQRDLVAAGKPSVAVMAAFQIPPSTIFSLKSSNIHDPRDLAGKKVGYTTDYWKRILEQTLTAAGVDPSAVTEVKVEVNDLEKLYDGTVDAWLGYAQDEPIRATISGHPVTNIFPADFGIGGYEGLVIATQATIDASPAMVGAFVKASEQGWRYAIEHPDEAAQILTSWAKDTSVDFQKLAVRAVAPLVDTPQYPIGWIDSARWQQLMADAYDSAHPGFTMQFSPATP
jgi:ABC-type nitrate/sulfonate/bicarbonate transport system substrate-binding protein